MISSLVKVRQLRLDHSRRISGNSSPQFKDVSPIVLHSAPYVGSIMGAGTLLTTLLTRRKQSMLLRTAMSKGVVVVPFSLSACS
jgi:hypothetical protein